MYFNQKWKSVTNIQRVKNKDGYVSFLGKPVYCPLDKGSHDIKCLGRRLQKNHWISIHLKDVDPQLNDNDRALAIHKQGNDLNVLLKDWALFRNGWLFVGEAYVNLFNYLCQRDVFDRPKALEHLKPYKRCKCWRF